MVLLIGIDGLSSVMLVRLLCSLERQGSYPGKVRSFLVDTEFDFL